jgi:hypothetical protein
MVLSGAASVVVVVVVVGAADSSLLFLLQPITATARASATRAINARAEIFLIGFTFTSSRSCRLRANARLPGDPVHFELESKTQKQHHA